MPVKFANISPEFSVLVEERRQRLLDLVSQKGFASLTDLAQSLEASESTIRRDLDFWDQRGVIRRSFGATSMKRSV